MSTNKCRVSFVVLFSCLIVILLAWTPSWMAADLNAQAPVEEPSAAAGNRITIDFESLRDLEAVTNQFANFGVSFTGATVLGQGASLNFLHFPPHSGVNVLYDDPAQSGRITVDFNPAVAIVVTRVGAYVTGNRNVTMTAYDATDNELGSASTGGANHAPDGVPNKLLEISTTQAIHKVVFFNGGERGNTYTVDDLYFESGLACNITGVPLYKQDAPAEWADDDYGGSVSAPWYDYDKHVAKVADWGCAMTSAAMVVSYYGDLQGEQTTTPGELNDWLRRNHGYSQGMIIWAKVAEFARDEKNIDLYYYENWGPNNGVINAFLCNRAPMILHTTSSPYSYHFVVATGVASATAWAVNDPGGYNLTSMNATPAKSYRKYGPEEQTPEYLSIIIHPPNSPDRGRQTASEAVSIVVTDPAGRVLQYNAITGTYENGILDANFGVERLTADNGSGTTIEAYTFGTGAPLEGNYEVQITTHVGGNYQIDLLGYDSAGTSSVASTNGVAPAGGQVKLGVGYSPDPGSELDLTPPDWATTGQLFLPVALQIPYVRPDLPLLNGNFESGPANWTEVSSHGWPIIVSNGDVDDLPTHSGSWAAWLGGDDDEIAYVEQTVTVPANRPFLTYYHGIASQDSCGHDFGGVVLNDAVVVDQYDLCRDANTPNWVLHAVNLSAYAGQDVTLQIRVETNGSLNSNLFVDDVDFSTSGVRLGEKPRPFVWNMARAALPLSRGAVQTTERLLGLAR